MCVYSARWRRQRRVRAQRAPRCAQTALYQQHFAGCRMSLLASAAAYGLLHALAQSLYMSSGGASERQLTSKCVCRAFA